MSYSRDEPLLRIENVSKSYGAKKVLNGINLTVRDLHCSEKDKIIGQVVALLGPSGCGKSTLFKLIAGLEDPTEGIIKLVNSEAPVKAGQVGVVLQNYPMSRNRTVLSNIALAGRIVGMSEGEASNKATLILEQFGLSDTANKYPIELSGGMRQRVAIARQLINMDGGRKDQAQLLLMDEPFSALDVANTRMVCKLIRSVADSNDKRTIIVVTHDIRAAISLADTIWVMEKSQEGGVISKEVDLTESGFIWNNDIYGLKEFSEMENELIKLLIK